MEKENTQPGVMLYFEIMPALMMLKDKQRLAVYDAIMRYGQYGEEPDLKGEAAICWGFIQSALDRDRERYERVVEARRKGGEARGKQISQEAEERRRLASMS